MNRWRGGGHAQASTRTGVYTHCISGQREGRRGWGRKTRRDLLLGIYCYYPEGKDHSATGNGDAYGVGCVYLIRAVRARTHVFVRVYATVHGCTNARRIVAMNRHPCIPSPSDLRFVVPTVAPMHYVARNWTVILYFVSRCCCSHAWHHLYDCHFRTVIRLSDVSFLCIWREMAFHC